MNFIPTIILFSAFAYYEVKWILDFLDREDHRMAGEEEVHGIISRAVLVGPMSDIKRRIALAAKKIHDLRGPK